MRWTLPPGPGSPGSERMACVLLSWYFPLPSSPCLLRGWQGCGCAHPHWSPHPGLLPPAVLQASAATPACLLLGPRSVQLGTLPAQAGPRDLAIRMNSLMHEGLHDHIPTAGMCEGKLAGSHVYPLSVDDKFTSFTDYC